MSRNEDERDQASLLDRLAAARECLSYVEGIEFAVFDKDTMRVRAVERTLEILGEAARRLTDDLRARHPAVPWRRIAGQRNFIAHGYEHVVSERLWLVATAELPGLVEQLEEIIRSIPRQS
jgi:uncharacterized protein with HEPN domain